jgi:hypothetical protein
LSRLKPLLPSSQVPLVKKQSIETFACVNGGEELHVVEEGVKAKRILEGMVVVDKSVIESPPAKS